MWQVPGVRGAGDGYCQAQEPAPRSRQQDYHIRYGARRGQVGTYLEHGSFERIGTVSLDFKNN